MSSTDPPAWYAVRKKNRMKASLFGSALLLALISSPALGDCPPGSQQIRVERVGDEERTYCKCLPGYVVSEGQCVLKMPTVDPAFFVSSDHSKFVSNELQSLHTRKERLEKQLKSLDQLRENQDEYLKQMGELRQQVVYDSVGDVLALVSTTELLAKIPGLSPQNVEELSRTMKLFKLAVDSVASAEAGPDKERAREKALDARSGALSLLAKIGAPEKEREALSKFVEASYEAIKATEAQQNAVDKPLGDRVVKALDGIAAIAGAISAPVGAARSAVNVTGAGIVLWKIQHDKESLVDALVSSQRAKLAADQRLATTNEMIKFYEVELKKAGNKEN